MKNILGLDIGTNSIGWALIESELNNKRGNIEGLGSRIIPMSQDILDKFGKGQSHSQTAERTKYRGVRRLYQRDILRRERLHRVLKIIDFLPKHYAASIDFEKHFGQFKKGIECKLNYKKNEDGKHQFIFKDSFLEMVEEFKKEQPELFKSKNGKETKIPYDWTIYYLRKKALTEKISKEELAWLILNFNQKRGYYQLRGEEEESSEDKGKEFLRLTVKDIVDSGEVIKKTGDKLYNVKFSNDWEYDKQIVKTENWIGKTKEFIVTTTTTKNGEIKRTFKAVDSEKDWPAIKAKTEQDIMTSKNTVGTYIYNTLLQNPKQKIRGKLIATIERKFYREELEAIIREQTKFHNELKDRKLYSACIEELYPQNEIHKNIIKQKDFEYMFVQDIIFYQRALKSKKSTISNCSYESRSFLIDKSNFENYYNNLILDIDKNINEFIADICFVKDVKVKNKKGKEITKKIDVTNEFVAFKKSEEFINYLKNSKSDYQKLLKLIGQNDIYITKYTETKLKGIPKSHPLYQEFRLWQFLKNLKIYQKEKIVDGRTIMDVDVTNELLKIKEDRELLFDFLNGKKEIEQKQLIQFFIINKLIDKNNKDNFRWNYVEDKKYPCNETRAQLLSRLKKVKNLDVFAFFTPEVEYKLWHIIYSVKDRKEFERAIENFAEKHKIDKESFVNNFKGIPPFKSAYGSYSEKALKKILPLMRIGKYWNDDEISQEVKDRISRIKERLKSINYNEEVFNTDQNNKLETIVDDAVPRQLLKSFVGFKDKNHLEGLNTYQACYAVYERHSEASDIARWETPQDIDSYLEKFKQHSLRNPIVEQIITETLRTVRDIWQYYGNGQKNFFDEVHIELGRDMKNDKKAREKISKRNIENENTNQRIKALLQELMNDGAKPFSPSHQEILKIYEEGVYQNPDTLYKKVSEDDISKIRKKTAPTKADIQKYKLWLEQGYRSPYTGNMIPLGKLFTTEYQIEHIIPQARFFDNSLSNKVICESEVNQLKGKKTAYEFIKNPNIEIIDLGQGKRVKLLTLEQYESHCKRYFIKNKTKLKKLLSEDVPESFIERQLNDTRYISKFIKGLLSNIVREDGEKEATSKNIVPVSGAITAILKQDWGLNEKWNELVQPRFERLNRLTNSKDFGDWDYQKDENGNNVGKRFFRTQVPEEVSKGFSKKRIDHRHHALDALVIACTTRKHIQYLNSLNNQKEKYSLQPSLLVKNKNGHFTKQFLKPWNNFTVDVKNKLEKVVISFKKNNRVINKTNNKTWQWVEDKGLLKKKKVKQTKGDNWAIRKPLHKETVYGKLNWGASKDKIITASRVSLSEIKTIKHLKKITDLGIRKILVNHLKNYVDESGKDNYGLAFNADGIEELNKNIFLLNNNKFHHPIYKVRFWEEGKKFSVGERGYNNKKYVEAAKGTNLFFAIYWNEEKQKREYETIPLNEVIAHQKWRATLPREEMKQTPMIHINKSKGRFLFSLSPNDLAYVPTEEEREYPHHIDFSNLSKKQIGRLMNVNDFSDETIYFRPNNLAKAIVQKEVDMKLNVKKEKISGSFSDKTASFERKQIKEICWKLKVDRLGNIVKVVVYE